MQFTLAQAPFLSALQAVVGAVEGRQTVPILSHVLLKLEAESVTLIATDLEIELQAFAPLSSLDESGEITLPARKLLDVLRTLPNDVDVKVTHKDGRATLKAAQSRFTLSTLDPAEFPRFSEKTPATTEMQLPVAALTRLFKKTSFAMAQQDVRYYLNGLSLQVKEGRLLAAASNGHRLAHSAVTLDNAAEDFQLILPRKSVLELSKLIEAADELIDVAVSSTSMKVVTPTFVFISKLIEGQFPDFQKAMPARGENVLTLDRDTLKSVFSRVVVLANEKFYGVSLKLEPGKVAIQANNPEQEQADVELDLDYQGEALEICFNAKYLLDVLNVAPEGPVNLIFSNTKGPVMVEWESDQQSVYIVMPMRL